jgi:hypothetical protein
MGTPIRTAGMGITTDIAGTEVTTIIGIIDTGATTTRNSYRFDDPATCPRQHVLLAQRCTLAMRDVRFGSKADICSATAHVCFVPITDIASLIAQCRR